MQNDVLLQVKDVWLQRPGAEVLRGVNLTVGRGEVHALLGLNGSGKTSLALTLMGASGYRPERGRILFDGQDITNLSVTERARLGLGRPAATWCACPRRCRSPRPAPRLPGVRPRASSRRSRRRPRA